MNAPARMTGATMGLATLLFCNSFLHAGDTVREPLAAAKPAPGETSELSASLRVEVDGPLLAGLPLQLKLTIANTGKYSIPYWCGGPGRYPSAEPFIIAVTDSRGSRRRLRLDNGQYGKGSGRTYHITATQVLPAACRPLPAGAYTLQVTGRSKRVGRDGKLFEIWPAMSAEPIRVTLKDDAAARAAAEKDILARADTDPFARHVAQVYGIDPVVKTWLDQLLNDDPRAAFKSVGYLQQVHRLPVGGDALLKQAAVKHSHPRFGTPDKNLLREISLIARNVCTDEALDAVITIANSDVDNYARSMAVADLRYFPQKRADEALMALAAREDSPLYWRALTVLANRHNYAALAPLLKAAADKDPTQRAFALVRLCGLRDVPAARKALTTALADPDPSVRQSGKKALEFEVPDEDVEF
jgi:hypothetical protein